MLFVYVSILSVCFDFLSCAPIVENIPFFAKYKNVFKENNESFLGTIVSLSHDDLGWGASSEAISKSFFDFSQPPEHYTENLNGVYVTFSNLSKEVYVKQFDGKLNEIEKNTFIDSVSSFYKLINMFPNENFKEIFDEKPIKNTL